MGESSIRFDVPLLLWPSVAITFQRCKGKSQLSNDLGIRYGLSKIFLSLRVKEYLAESAPQLPTVYRHRQPSESIVKRNFTGRVAKKAKLIDGVNGQFLSMDMAVNDYSKGEETTQWVRVQSSDPAHLKLVEYFTKGRILTIQGNVKIDQWEGKDGTPHAQLRVHAKFIDFLNIGKKQEGANVAANAATDSNVPDVPTDTPKEKKDDLPF